MSSYTYTCTEGGLDLLKDAHIIVGTPKYLEALANKGHVPFNNAKFVVVDEVCMYVCMYVCVHI